MIGHLMSGRSEPLSKNRGRRELEGNDDANNELRNPDRHQAPSKDYFAQEPRDSRLHHGRRVSDRSRTVLAPQ